ncbi:MAG: cytochrome c [Flavobacteriales bacterium]|nr:MAG: cytochrome c [Flavobacteriales bacterium]
MVLKSFLFGLVLLSLACSDNSQEPLTGTPMEKGEQLYQIHCARCHGSDGSKGASGAKNLKDSQLGKAEIMQIIFNGKGVMPSYKNTIKGDSSIIWLADYVQALRK